MKWTKSIIGEIGFVDTENKLPYREALKKVPKGARIMEAWEALKLMDNDIESLKNIPKEEWYFTYGTDKYYRACRLCDFDNYSRFGAIDRLAGFSGVWLRGVLVVKKIGGLK